MHETEKDCQASTYAELMKSGVFFGPAEMAQLNATLPNEPIFFDALVIVAGDDEGFVNDRKERLSGGTW